MSFVYLVHFLQLLLAIIYCVQGEEDAPRITLAPTDQRVADQGTVSFFCKASGNPAPDIYWRKNERRIPTNRQRHIFADMPHGSVMRIEPVKLGKDDSVYECAADNGVGEMAVVSARLDIYPHNANRSGYPVITEGPMLKAVEKDRNAVLVCSASGTPEPTIMWLKDYIPVDLTNPRVKLLPTGSLQILHAHESDEGKYECVAENSVGVSYSYAAYLYVRTRRVPPHFSIYPESADVMPGGAFNLTCVAVGSPMPYVKWRLGNIELTQEDSVPIGKNVLMLTDIRESANYTCVAASDLGNIEAVGQVRIKELPRPPTDLRGIDLSPTSIQLSWNSGNADLVDSYVIQYKPKNAPFGAAFNEIADILDASYEVTGLNSYTRFEFRVIAVNSVGRGQPSTIVEVSTGELAPGSPPLNVRARPLSSSSVVMQWDEPIESNGEIQGYKVFYSLASLNISLSFWTVHPVENSLLTTISNLMTNKTYSLAVLAFTRVGDGPLSEIIQVHTQQGVPGPPSNFRGVAKAANVIELSWDTPDVVSTESIQSYHLYYNNSNTKQNVRLPAISSSHNTYMLQDLIPDTVYHLRLTAKTSKGEGVSSPIIQLRTHEFKPVASPQAIQGRALDSESLELKWQPPPARYQNGLIAGYKVLYVELEGSLQNAKSILVVPTPTTTVIGGLKKWTSYKVWVLALTKIGDGPLSDFIILQTGEDVPGEPRKVRLEEVNSTSVKVEWRPPADKDQNGIIRGYQVHYVKINEADEPIGLAHMNNLMDNENELIVTGLLPESWYQFQVAAYTRKGEGERSKPKKLKTKGAVPSAPQALQLQLVTEDPPVVTVSWKPPKNTHGEILDYRLTYGVVGESTEERHLEKDKLKFTTGYLERGAKYEFRMSAKNAIDYGELAVETLLTPDGTPAGAPQNFTATAMSSTSVRLNWDTPARSLRNGDIILYEIVYYKRLESLNANDVNTTNTELVLEGLEMNTDYIFQIKAYTFKGAGPWSNQVPFRTFGRMPPAPKNVKVFRTSPTGIEVSWDMVDYSGITNFRVYYTTKVDTDMKRWHHVQNGPYHMTAIDNLEPHSDYAVRVQAISADDVYGNLSDIFTINAFVAESPEMVREVWSKTQNPTFVEVEWKPPHNKWAERYKVWE